MHRWYARRVRIKFNANERVLKKTRKNSSCECSMWKMKFFPPILILLQIRSNGENWKQSHSPWFIVVALQIIRIFSVWSLFLLTFPFWHMHTPETIHTCVLTLEYFSEHQEKPAKEQKITAKRNHFYLGRSFGCNEKLSAEVDGSVNLFKVFETLETTIDLFYAITLSPIIKRQAFNQHRPANAMCFGVWKSTRNVNIVFTHYHVWQNIYQTAQKTKLTLAILDIIAKSASIDLLRCTHDRFWPHNRWKLYYSFSRYKSFMHHLIFSTRKMNTKMNNLLLVRRMRFIDGLSDFESIFPHDLQLRLML